jgi:hypothetical protein
MSNMISNAIAIISASFKQLQVQRFLSVALTGCLLFGAAMNMGRDTDTLGERMRDRIEQTDRNSERPKTTGEFLDEARGDIPLGERMKNITRDSREALNQFGKEYSVGAQESLNNIKDSATDAARDLR